MKYTINIGGRGEIEVDQLDYGIGSDGACEGWADLYIYVRNKEEDIYNDANKVWIEWLDQCCGEKDNPRKRIQEVVAKVYGGPKDDEIYRTIHIQNGYIDQYIESSQGTEYFYQATIRRAPLMKGLVKVMDA